MKLCPICIEEATEKEDLHIGKLLYTEEESEEKDITCDWCGQHDDLYDVR